MAPIARIIIGNQYYFGFINHTLMSGDRLQAKSSEKQNSEIWQCTLFPKVSSKFHFKIKWHCWSIYVFVQVVLLYFLRHHDEHQENDQNGKWDRRKWCMFMLRCLFCQCRYGFLRNKQTFHKSLSLSYSRTRIQLHRIETNSTANPSSHVKCTDVHNFTCFCANHTKCCCQKQIALSANTAPTNTRNKTCSNVIWNYITLQLYYSAETDESVIMCIQNSCGCHWKQSQGI